jgi:hypothetical protein
MTLAYVAQLGLPSRIIADGLGPVYPPGVSAATYASGGNEKPIQLDHE